MKRKQSRRARRKLSLEEKGKDRLIMAASKRYRGLRLQV